MNIELGMRPPSSPCDIIPTRLSGEIMGAIRSNVLSIINSSLFWMCTRPFLRHSVFNCYSGSRGLESTDSKKKKNVRLCFAARKWLQKGIRNIQLHLERSFWCDLKPAVSVWMDEIAKRAIWMDIQWAAACWVQVQWCSSGTLGYIH